MSRLISPRGHFYGLLASPVKSDMLSHIKFGSASDAHSVAVLYRSDGDEDGVTTPNPQLDGFLVPIVLNDLQVFKLTRNGRPLPVPNAVRRGGFGVHDLRNSFAAPKYPVFSLSLVFSTAFLEDMRPGPGRAMDLLTENVEYESIDETLLHLGMALLPQFENPGAADGLFVNQLLLSVGSYLLGKYGRNSPTVTSRSTLSYKQERMAKEFLISNMHNNISLSDTAGICGLSSAYFARAFKKTTGVSPYKWLMLRRIDLAKSFLATTDNSLVDIASSCGFCDQSHFTRMFSRVVGVSPGAWRRLKKY